MNFERQYIYKNKLIFCKKFIDFLKSTIDKSIFKQIRNSLIKDETVIFVGSAHLAKPLEDFLQIMNIKHVQHYGLTETTGLDVSNTLESQKKHPYTVGIPFSKTVLKIINPDTHEEVKQGDVGLITLQGPEILKGYYNNEEATKKAIFEEHFLNTGDLGYIDKDGYLIVLSRYDDVIVMSNGYNVYTPLLENEAKDSEYVKQLVIAGHGKPYLTSLIVLNDNEYKNWCNENNCSNIQPNENNEFKTFLTEELNEKIKRKKDHKYYEKLKNIYFLDDEFTFENGMLTGTLKIKYRKVINTYQSIIDSMYKE
ncbi:AMP-binding protein [bacterium]|nr:AMP-binding protein [bacterium]